MRRSSSSAVRSKAGYVVRSVEPSSDGSGTLQWTCSVLRAERRAHLANPVAQGDDRVEPFADEFVDVLAAVQADVDPALAHHAHRIRMERLGMTPGAVGIDRTV